MKRAQVSSQMVFYVLGIIIIGFLLLFGTRVILSSEQKFETIDVTSFRQTLERNVNDLAPSYGSWKIVELDVPRKVEKVYFLSLERPVADRNIPDNDLVTDYWKSNSSNVVTIPFSAQSSMLIDKIIINDPDGYKEFNVIDGKITIKIVGLGNGVRIEEEGSS